MTQLTGVVVAHGNLAAAMIDAVERIAGAGSGLRAVSNTDCDRGRLEERITEAVGSGPGIVFIDMPSGSCMFAAMHKLKSNSDVRVVTGVNLAMLLEFVFHRDGPVDEIATHVADVGARAVATR